MATTIHGEAYVHTITLSDVHLYSSQLQVSVIEIGAALAVGYPVLLNNVASNMEWNFSVALAKLIFGST